MFVRRSVTDATPCDCRGRSVVVVDLKELLGGQTRQLVDAARTYRMIFRDRQHHRAPVLTARSPVDEPRRRIHPAAGFEQHGRALDVHLDVGERMAQAQHVVVLPGEMEHVVLAGHEVLEARLIPDVAEVDGDAISDRLHVEEVAAVIVEHRVEQRHAGAEGNQADGEIAPEESQTSGDRDFTIAKALETGAHEGCAGEGNGAGAGAPDSTTSRTTNWGV